MAELTPEGLRIVDDAARRHGLSADAVRTLLEAIAASGGGMAQFSHPELGGMGQWAGGGMIMIGDMFNSGLKSRIDALCGELSDLVRRTDAVVAPAQSGQRQSRGGTDGPPPPRGSLFVGAGERGGSWWPADLGAPASVGSQNNMRYACFPDRRRLALEVNGELSVYDTGEHWITGFSQQQSGDQSLSFTSQLGTVRLGSLTRVSGSGPPASRPADDPGAGTARPDDIFVGIERLGDLRDKGLLSDEEFTAKKTELLKRL